MTKNKVSNVELVKIIAMLMIVCHHFVTLNTFNIDTDIVGLSWNKLFLQFIGNHAFVANNLFFLCSAWFLCVKNDEFEFKHTVNRLWNLDKVMLFYSLGIPMILFSVTGQWGGHLYNALFPLTTNLWWYPTSYAIFLIFYPFMQKALLKLDRNEIKQLITVMFCLWTVMTIIPYRWELGGGNTTCFFMLYTIAYYIRHYNPEILRVKLSPQRLVLWGYALGLTSIVLLDILGSRINVVNKYSCYYIRGNERLLPVLISIGLFLWIVKGRQFHSKFINWMGGLTFAIYLIHMHPQIQPILFEDWFDMTGIVQTPIIFPYAISITFAIFAVCLVIDQCRKWLYNGIEWILSLRIKKKNNICN